MDIAKKAYDSPNLLEIYSKNIIFDSEAISLNINIKFKDLNNKEYPISSILLLIKNIPMKHFEYIESCQKTGFKMVDFKDKTKILDIIKNYIIPKTYSKFIYPIYTFNTKYNIPILIEENLSLIIEESHLKPS